MWGFRRTSMRSAPSDVILSVEDQSKPLDVRRWEGAVGERTIIRVWEVLEQKVRAYWTAPNMPVQQWVSPRGRL